MERSWSKFLFEVEQCLKNLYEYVTKGDFGTSINMGTYFTIMLSILMVYGIFLSFLQYATKEYSSPLLYMGLDLYKESLFASNQNIWNLVDWKYAFSLFLLGILPIGAKVALIGAKSQFWHNILLAMWMGINIFIAGIFSVVFVKCAKALLKLMNSKEVWLLRYEARSYNNRYMKRCRKKRKLDVDAFYERVMVICKYWGEDEKIEKDKYVYNYDSDYLSLVNQLINFYGKKRRKHVARIKQGKEEKVEYGIIYNLRREIEAFYSIYEMVEKKDMEISEIIQFILERNTVLKNGIEIYIRDITEGELYNFVKSNLEELINGYFKIYNYCLKRYKDNSWSGDRLLCELRDDFQFFVDLGNDDVCEFAYRAANRVFEKNIEFVLEKKNKNALDMIFYVFRKNMKTKNWYVNWLDSFVESNRVDMEMFQSIIEQMDKEDRVYILLHLFFYYSIYDSRIKWKHFDLKLMRGLVDNEETLWKEMERGEESLVAKLEKPMNMWRFNVNMFNKLKEYMKQPLSIEHLILVKKENQINYKYYFALRVVCWGEHDSDASYEINNREMQRELLTFISIHPEFFEEINFRIFWEQLRKENYQKIKLGREMERYTVEELVIADFAIDAGWVKELIRENRYLTNDVFRYLVLSYASSHDYEYLEHWIKSKIPYYIDEGEENKETYIAMLLEIYERYKIEKSRYFEWKLKELFDDKI